MLNLLFGGALLAAPGDLWESTWLSLRSGERFALLVVVIGCAMALVTSVTAIAARTANAMHRRRIEEGLKRDMLDRGMSADEIVRIIESAAPPEDATSRWIASWCCKK